VDPGLRRTAYARYHRASSRRRRPRRPRRDHSRLHLDSQSHGRGAMTNTELDLTDLASVNGGMNTDGWRQSENIEDRRGMSLEDSMKVAWPQPEPLPPLVRTPGDLPSQAGLD